ncbi:MAG: alpha/beta fold hydrolase [Phycisphaerales bacterium JB039]
MATTSAASGDRPTVTFCSLAGLEAAVRARVEDVGSGEPIVFLHGLVGLNEHWETVARSVAEHFRCIMLELPLLNLRGDDCSIDGVTRLTAAFLDEYLPGEPVILVGNSFGGHVAARVALERPDQVRGLVLAGASGLIEKSMVSDVQLRPSREWLKRKIGELFYDPDRYMNPADLDRAHRELSDRAGARAMVRLSKSARRNHLGSRIGKIQAPTLLVWGRNDIVTPPEAALQFDQLLPNSRLVWFDRCGHAPMMEQPDGFALAVVEFASGLSGSGS